MSFLTNICHPKEEHFDSQTKNQTFKHIDEYIFESRNLQKIRLKTQAYYHDEYNTYPAMNTPYRQNSNYPYSQANHYPENEISKAHTPNFNNTFNQTRSSHKENHKLSFKQITQRLCSGQKSRDFNDQEDREISQRGENNMNNQRYMGNNSRQAPYFVATSPDREYQDYNMKNKHQPYQKNQIYQKQNNSQKNSKYLQNLQQLSKAFLLKQNEQLRLKNTQLKRLIHDQYQPMRQLYTKLIKQQQQREYLVSKLEWKVKELVKEIQEKQQNKKGVINPHNKKQEQTAYKGNTTKYDTSANINHYQQNGFNNNPSNNFNNNVANHQNYVGQNVFTSPIKSSPVIVQNQFIANVNERNHSQNNPASQPIINVGNYQQQQKQRNNYSNLNSSLPTNNYYAPSLKQNVMIFGQPMNRQVSFNQKNQQKRFISPTSKALNISPQNNQVNPHNFGVKIKYN